MKNYIIKKMNNFYLVFGTSVESPLFMLQEIEGEINEKGDVDIIFDQLLQTGNSENRFMKLIVRKGKIDLQTAQIIDYKEISNDIKKEISLFLKANLKLLQYSILLNEQKEYIKQGGIL